MNWEDEINSHNRFWGDESYWAKMPTNAVVECEPIRRRLSWREWAKIVFALVLCLIALEMAMMLGGTE